MSIPFDKSKVSGIFIFIFSASEFINFTCSGCGVLELKKFNFSLFFSTSFYVRAFSVILEFYPIQFFTAELDFISFKFKTSIISDFFWFDNYFLKFLFRLVYSMLYLLSLNLSKSYSSLSFFMLGNISLF